jgi:hypothetical protein
MFQSQSFGLDYNISLDYNIPETWLCAGLSLPRQPGQWSGGEFCIHLTLPHDPSGTPLQCCEMLYLREGWSSACQCSKRREPVDEDVQPGSTTPLRTLVQGFLTRRILASVYEDVRCSGVAFRMYHDISASITARPTWS